MKTFAVIVAFYLCFALNAQEKPMNQCRWQNGDKIEKSDYQLIKKSKLYCSLSNDKDYVFINLMISDREVSESILEDGLTIWIDMEGKQAKKMGVRFPIGSENAGTFKTQADEKNKGTQDLVLQANTIELLGFISEQERHFAAQNSDNFRGAVKYSPDGDLYYRLVMPLAKLPVRNSRDGNGAMPFSLGFEIGYLPPDRAKNQPKNQSHEKGSHLFWINEVRLATSR